MKLYSLKRGGVRTWLAAFAVTQLFLLASGQAPASETFIAEKYAGKVVVLDFWASWCVPCRRSFPWLNAMHEKYADDGLVIIGVNLDMERADAEQFLQEYPADFAILYDENQELARQFEVVAMPSSYVIGRGGKIVARHMGFKVKQQDEYESIIVDALRKPENENE
jgi:thiol-disulfide isomerase/thioredoxin